MEIKTNCIVEHDGFICVDAYDYAVCSNGVLGARGRCTFNVNDNCTCVTAMKYAALEQMDFLKKWLDKNRG
jgi:hypothetical protein